MIMELYVEPIRRQMHLVVPRQIEGVTIDEGPPKGWLRR